MDLARFKKEDTSYTLCVPAVTKVNEDGSFHTRAKSKGDFSAGHYRRVKLENVKNQEKIIPEIDYEMFELTKNPNEADLLTISYYMGLEIKNIVKTTGEKTFIVDEKLKIKGVSSEVNEQTGFKDKLPYYDNDILNYRAFKHHPKKLADAGYKGDCNTEIKLADNCSYKLYKFIGIRNF